MLGTWPNLGRLYHRPAVLFTGTAVATLTTASSPPRLSAVMSGDVLRTEGHDRIAA